MGQLLDGNTVGPGAQRVNGGVLAASGFAQLPCRVTKWRRPRYVENLVDQVLAREASKPTYAQQRIRRAGYPGELQTLMRRRVAQLQMHGHTRNACQTLVATLIGHAVGDGSTPCRTERCGCRFPWAVWPQPSAAAHPRSVSACRNCRPLA
ncbi:hypothetical protein GCM10025871_38570 [Deinococcus metallilatus]|nr:hypothetical protein GCM10025871_38570 [Deinococcus metallilatus]